MSIHPRFLWAVTILDIQPTDTILEIGCGVGIAVELVAQHLSSGTITALDSSAAMIARASKRNRTSISSGKVALFAGELTDVKLPTTQYDKIFAFNVSLFWKTPAQELQNIASHLLPDGALYIFHQPPHDITKQVVEKTTDQLLEHGFEVVKITIEDMLPAPVSCIIARPAGRKS